jgi:poly-gamma-glutamate capsule biosynthesis protein CapA/YwtB (metallophosphatase superfamily)
VSRQVHPPFILLDDSVCHGRREWPDSRPPFISWSGGTRPRFATVGGMTRSGWSGRYLAAGVLALAVAACNAEPAAPRSPVPSASRSASSAGPGAEGADSAPTQPLVLVTHATRPPLMLTRAVARRVLAGQVRRWAQLDDRSRGRLRVVAAPGVGAATRLEVTSARAAVRAVVGDRRVLAVVPAHAAGPRVQAARVGGVDPFRRPKLYPLRTSATTTSGPVVTMSVAGDIMLGRGVAAAARGTGDLTPALRPMQRRLAAADLTVGNLESTLSRAGPPTQGGDSFAADPGVTRGLRDAGFDVLDLANNHLGDFGPRALVQTVRRLRADGLRTFGAAANSRRAWQPAVVERAGVRFGFLGFNAIGETPEVATGRPGAVSVSMPPRTGPLDRAELRRFLDAVRRLDGRVDVVVVFPHWGTQYTNVPEPVQRHVARQLVSAGADLVAGGHPHWVQGAAMVRDRLVVHSLGNFVFDMDFMDETMRGLLLELTYWGAELKAARFVPYRMDTRFAPRVQSYREGIETLRLMWATSGPAFHLGGG